MVISDVRDSKFYSLPPEKENTAYYVVNMHYPCHKMTDLSHVAHCSCFLA